MSDSNVCLAQGPALAMKARPSDNLSLFILLVKVETGVLQLLC